MYFVLIACPISAFYGTIFGNDIDYETSFFHCNLKEEIEKLNQFNLDYILVKGEPIYTKKIIEEIKEYTNIEVKGEQND